MLCQRLIGDNPVGKWLFALLSLSLLLVPIGNLVLPPDSALHVPTYAVTILGKYFCYAMLALALDLIWGYCGILSLGHGAFFALGGYVMGMHLMRQIGERGVYGHPDLPDFMVFLNWDELPWYWHGFDSIWFTVIIVLALIILFIQKRPRGMFPQRGRAAEG